MVNFSSVSVSVLVFFVIVECSETSEKMETKSMEKENPSMVESWSKMARKDLRKKIQGKHIKNSTGIHQRANSDRLSSAENKYLENSKPRRSKHHLRWNARLGTDVYETYVQEGLAKPRHTRRNIPKIKRKRSTGGIKTIYIPRPAPPKVIRTKGYTTPSRKPSFFAGVGKWFVDKIRDQ